MKNILNAFKLTIAVLCLQISTASSAFAQTENLSTVVEKSVTNVPLLKQQMI